METTESILKLIKEKFHYLIKKIYFFSAMIIKPLFQDQIWDGGAALSFYLILSLFPGIIVLLGLASFLPLQETMTGFSDYALIYLPESQLELFQSVVDDISGGHQGGLLSFGFLFALWTATTGVGAIIRQLNIIYEINDRRNLIRVRLISAGIAFTLIFSFMLSFLALVVGKGLTTLLVDLDLIPWTLNLILPLIRYSLAGAVVFVIFAIVNVLGPHRKKRGYVVFPGCFLSSVLFLFSSFLFSFYLNKVTDYSATYGSIGTVIGLLMWLYLFSLSLLIGAEFNHSLDKRKKINSGLSTKVNNHLDKS